MKNAERTVQLIVKVSAEERNEIYARMLQVRVNETRNIYEEDILDLQRMYSEVKAKVSERLVKMMND